jgi:hypothetical protein
VTRGLLAPFEDLRLPVAAADLIVDYLTWPERSAEVDRRARRQCTWTVQRAVASGSTDKTGLACGKRTTQQPIVTNPGLAAFRSYFPGTLPVGRDTSIKPLRWTPSAKLQAATQFADPAAYITQSQPLLKKLELRIGPLGTLSEYASSSPRGQRLRRSSNSNLMDSRSLCCALQAQRR